MSTPKFSLLAAPHHVLAAGAVLVAIASPALAQDKTNSGVITSDTIFAGSGYLNSGTISNPSGNALSASGSVATVTNAAGATLSAGAGGTALSVAGDIGAFVNHGTASGGFIGIDAQDIGTVTNTGAISGATAGFYVDNVGSLVNSATGTISGLSTALNIRGDLDSFSNAGTIAGRSGYGLVVAGKLDSFTNLASGKISGFYGLGVGETTRNFVNAGTIIGIDKQAAQFYGDVTSFSNLAGGRISGVTGLSPPIGVLHFGGVTSSFFNAGTIEGTGTPVGMGTVTFIDTVDHFRNEAGGEIIGRNVAMAVGLGKGAGTFENAGLISNNQTSGPGVLAYAGVSRLHNQAGGRIESRGESVLLAAGTTLLINDGIIDSADMAAIRAYDVTQVINSGTLQGGAGMAVYLAGTDDKLSIVTGSKIDGLINFGTGTDTLDFAGFAGSTRLDVQGLETINEGKRSYFDFRDNAGDGEIVIFDISALGNQMIGQSLLDLTLAGNGLIGDQLGAPAPAAPLPYAPAATSSAAAVLSELDTAAPDRAKLWGGSIGGGSLDAASNSSAYGGIVFGSHALLANRFSLGGTAGYVVSGSRDAAGTQSLSTQTALAGLYGEADFENAVLDFSLLGGASAHSSKRDVTNGLDTETASGLFNSLFLAPRFGVTLPMLSGEAGELSVKASATYVAGLTTAYTETGSSLNLSVGQQLISVVDGRIGVEHRAGALTTKAGVLVQINAGSASVPVTAFGETIDVATPGATNLAAYGGLAYDAALTEKLDLALSLDGSLRADGRATAAARLSLAGSF